MTETTVVNEANYENVQEALWKVLAEADDAIDQVVPFLNDDAPKYLENLQRFEEESRKVDLQVI